MKHTLLLLLAASCMLFSCKGKDEDLNPTPAGLISGYLSAARQLDIDSPATKYTESAQAFFVLHPGDTMRITVDSVRLNGYTLPLDNGTKLYKAASNLQLDKTCNWQVWSTTNISTFTYNFAMPYPGYTYKMPDTIDRSKGLNIQVPTGADSSTITLISNQRLTGSYKGTTGSFSAGELSSFNAGMATLEVSGYARSTVAFGGKNFLFTKQTTKAKVVLLQ